MYLDCGNIQYMCDDVIPTDLFRLDKHQHNALLAREEYPEAAEESMEEKSEADCLVFMLWVPIKINLKGLLPKGPIAFHMITKNMSLGLTVAVNDIGLI